MPATAVHLKRRCFPRLRSAQRRSEMVTAALLAAHYGGDLLIEIQLQSTGDLEYDIHYQCTDQATNESADTVEQRQHDD